MSAAITARTDNPPIASAEDGVWDTRCPVPTPFVLALRTGALERDVHSAGLNWGALQEASDPETHSSRFTRRKASAFPHGGNISAIWARARRADTHLVGLRWAEHSYVVLSLPESRIRTTADVRGRCLLVPRQNAVGLDFCQVTVLRTFEPARASVHLTVDDVTLLEIPTTRSSFADRARRSGPPFGSWPLHLRCESQQGSLLPLLRGEVDVVASQGDHGPELAGISGARAVFDAHDLDDQSTRSTTTRPTRSRSAVDSLTNTQTEWLA